MTVQLKQNVPLGVAVINWPGAQEIAVDVQLRSKGVARDVATVWRLTSAQAEDIRKAVKAAKIARGKPGSHYALRASVDGTTIDSSWDDTGEAPELRMLREQLSALAHLHFGLALASLRLGQDLRSRQQVQDAIAVFDYGISALGERYSSPDLIDDTSTKLILAQHNKDTGKLVEAATLFERVLESRTEAYRARYRPIR